MRQRFAPLTILLFIALCAPACGGTEGGTNNESGAQNPAVGSALDVDGSGNSTGSNITGTVGEDHEHPDSDHTHEVDGTIRGLQLAADSAGCSEEASFPETVAESVSIATAIVTSPRFVAYENSNGEVELHGYYICDGDQGVWSGVMLTLPAGENTNLNPGDTLTLVGDLKEAWCNTQLSVEANGYELTGSTEVPEPLDIDAFAEDMEPYEGMLIRLSEVLVESETSWGGYVLEGGIEVSYGFDFFLSMEVGKRYDITGQLRYAFGAYQLLPRSESDFNLTGESGSGGTTNPGTPVDPSDLDGTILALQEAAESAGCDENASFPNTVVESAYVSAAVVTSPRIEVSDYLHGYYVWDNTQAPWSGILMTLNASENTNFQLGDTLGLSGELQEAWCNTQLNIAANGWELTGTSELLSPVSVSADATDFEPYEGMLVSLSDVLVESETSWGGYVLEGGMEVSYGFDFFLSMEVGKRYDITGQIRYAYGAYQLLPRFLEDLLLVGEGPGDDPGGTTDPEPDTTEFSSITELQQGPESILCTDSSSIVTVSESVSVEGFVTVGSFEVHDTLNAYAISEGGSEEYSGLVIVVDKGADENWAVGTRIKVTGTYIEFYCMTEINASSVEVLDTPAQDPTPTPVDNADFAANSEAYEGMLVTLSDATVTSVENAESYGEFDTDAGFLIDDWITGKEVLATPEVGTSYCSLTGIVSYNFGSYRLNPRSADDLVLCE